MTALRVAHLSGRWDRSRQTLHDQLAHVSKTVDVMTFTEVADGTRRLALTLPGWSTGHYKLKKGEARGRAECAVMTRDSVWTMKRFATKMLGPDLGVGLATTAAFAQLTHKDGTKMVISVSHLPSAVEGDWDGKRAKAYRSAVENWRKTNLEWRKVYKPDVEIANADWNLNAHRDWVQKWLRKAWPGLRLPSVLPKGGTHGSRLIDFPITRGANGVRFTLYAANKASDHRAIRISGQHVKK